MAIRNSDQAHDDKSKLPVMLGGERHKVNFYGRYGVLTLVLC